ncbi:MAG: DUF2652 domain-containing protein [Acidimicrobiia bacterium]|nr:DUF2652 domain-containing protein [Acidimicrobiia bacterium]
MRGHLVLADISGYTRFLTESELEHANGIITELLEAVIGAIQAPLKVSSIEGDAVFMYGVMPEEMSGQTILESVELLYCSFAAALETMVLNTTCKCNACANINTLGMKIVMHCGDFVKSELAGRETLTGPDVIAAHRLLKNHVKEETGVSDYMLVTQACVDELGVQTIVESWTPHVETYDDVGEVAGFVSSLPDVWAFIRQQREDKVVQGEAWLSMSHYSKAPPVVVWDHLIDPIKRTQWLMAEDNQVEGRISGRIGAGSKYHCAHGDNEMSVFTVLDVRTLDYVTILMALPGGMGLRYTDYLVPSGSGTRIISYAAPAFVSETGETAPDDVLEAMRPMVGDNYQHSIELLVGMADAVAEEMAGV